MTHDAGLNAITKIIAALPWDQLNIFVKHEDGWGDYFEYTFPISSESGLNCILYLNFTHNHIELQHISSVLESCFCSFDNQESNGSQHKETLIQSIHNIITMSENSEFQQNCLKLMGVSLKDNIAKNMRIMLNQMQ